MTTDAARIFRLRFILHRYRGQKKEDNQGSKSGQFTAGYTGKGPVSLRKPRESEKIEDSERDFISM